MNSRQSLALAATLSAAVVISVPDASADPIEWGFDAAFTDSIDSFGTALDASYVFYLGDFGALSSSFTPTRANVSDWASNWQTLGTTTYSAATSFFTGNDSLSDNSVFAADGQVYIWGTNNGLSDSGEFVLLTSTSWVWPTANPIGLTVSEYLLTNGGPDTGVEAIVGAIDGSYDGDETGITFDASGGDGFDLQTEAVPEPAAALLFSISAIWFLFRRPRRATSFH